MRNQSDIQLLVVFVFFFPEEKMLQLNPDRAAKSRAGWQSQTWPA